MGVPATEKTEEAKPAVAPEPVIPLTAADIVLPEGFEADTALQEKLVGVMNDSALSVKDRTNALVALQAEAMTAILEKGNAQFTELRQKWVTEIKTDTVYGGPKLEANLLKINSLLDEYGTPALREVMNATGVGDNPELFRFLSKLAADRTEAKPVSGNPGGTAKSLEDKLYPSMAKAAGA